MVYSYIERSLLLFLFHVSSIWKITLRLIREKTSSMTVATTTSSEKMENRMRFPMYLFMNTPT